MKRGYFSKLAWDGIRKNKKLYLPYFLTCIGMVTMFYIITMLSVNPLLNEMSGGGNLSIILGLGKFVICAFSVIFLFYTNSFLMRRRNKEFGLYNILGMDKRSLSKIVGYESLLVGAISISVGLILGIALSKLAELGLMLVLHMEADFTFRISGEALWYTGSLYAAIFLLLFVNSLLRVYCAKPLDLFHSEAVGEKPPKANWLLALIGLGMLGGAYYLAVTIQSPLRAMTVFFAAVLMVIAATYLLFTAGSVTFCKLLQKNKGYYYKKDHFVSVSSMVYRMKRNGAGLASICILATMVLVMVASSLSLYIGAEDSLTTRYPRMVCVELSLKDEEQNSQDNLDRFRQAVEETAKEYSVELSNVLDYRYCAAVGLLQGEKLEIDPWAVSNRLLPFEDLTGLMILPPEEYTKITGNTLTLAPNEAVLMGSRITYEGKTLQIANGATLQIVGQLEDLELNGQSAAMSMPSIYLVPGDYEAACSGIKETDPTNENKMYGNWYYGVDLNCNGETEIAFRLALCDKVDKLNYAGFCEAYSCESRESNRSDFFTTFGGLFFIGIILSILFILAAIMIIYYKQISEGYEDQARFEIMQKVGMTKTDIRKSINSQILTVFFAPLLFAGLHLAFAFPLVWKILQIFNLRNLPLVIWVTIGAFVLFALCYAIVYRVTSNAYYSIVSDDKKYK